jgi:hypothetical protein
MFSKHLLENIESTSFLRHPWQRLKFWLQGFCLEAGFSPTVEQFLYPPFPHYPHIYGLLLFKQITPQYS